jgi:lipoic acid synthetase
MLMTAEQTENMSLSICDYGLSDYGEVLQQQLHFHRQRCEGKIPDTVLIAEHQPVITLGARQSANKLLAGFSDLKKNNIDIVETRRGGGATAHNPGQLVFYPILHLPDLGLGISEYIRELEATGAELLEQLGVKSRRRKGLPGLWVGKRKIASIGVRVSKSVTYHGMAINIQNDLSIFDYLIPCGLDGVEMTSVLNETGKKYSMNEVKSRLSQLLVRHFKSEIRNPKSEIGRLPPWLKRPLPASGKYNTTETVLQSLGIKTICHSANCPNRGQCWGRGTATVLILGNICTRNCKFCSVSTGKPKPPDPTELERLAEMVKQMGLKYLVITSVCRDDLPDGGAGHFRDCIRAVRRRCPDVKIEILTPDFRYCQNEAIEILAAEILSHRDHRGHREFVFAHNVETVPSLYSKARSGGDYQRSLNLLKMAKESCDGVPTKSSIMLGLGETDAEVEEVLRDLRRVGCDRIVIGQYLKPSKNSLEVVEYIRPEKFAWWRQKAIDVGFSWVISAPFARSSYFAEQENTLQPPLAGFDCSYRTLKSSSIS